MHTYLSVSKIQRAIIYMCVCVFGRGRGDSVYFQLDLAVCIDFLCFEKCKFLILFRCRRFSLITSYAAYIHTCGFRKFKDTSVCVCMCVFFRHKLKTHDDRNSTFRGRCARGFRRVHLIRHFNPWLSHPSSYPCQR